MGACASSGGSSPSSSRRVKITEVDWLHGEYEVLLHEIYRLRASLIDKFVVNDSEKLTRIGELSFFDDFNLACKNIPGMKKGIQTQEDIIALQRVQERFQRSETRVQQSQVLSEYLHSCTFEEEGPTSTNSTFDKPKKPTAGKKIAAILHSVVEMRTEIYDYFYSDLELTDVPDEII